LAIQSRPPVVNLVRATPIAAKTPESLTEGFGRIVAVEYRLDGDRFNIVRRGLEAQKPAVISVEPLAHLSKCLGEFGSSNTSLDDLHSGSALVLLYRAASEHERLSLPVAVPGSA
jgi:hypothetical protein